MIQMAEVAEQLRPTPKFPSIRWLTRIFHGRPQSAVETPFPISPVPEPIVIKPAMPVTAQVPKPSGRELRTTRIREYRERQAATRPIDAPAPPPANARPAEVPFPQVSEAIPANLPSGIKERVKFPHGLLITEADMPWLNGDRVQVVLEKMTLATSNGEQFLYGSLIYGKKLRRLFSQFTPGELRSADNLLFVQLSELIQYRFAPDIEMVHNRINKKRGIFETGNQNGGRVYFMRLDQIEGLPVIIRIAAAKDHKIGEVLSVICRERG